MDIVTLSHSVQASMQREAHTVWPVLWFEPAKQTRTGASACSMLANLMVTVGQEAPEFLALTLWGLEHVSQGL